jgi:glycerol-3-phosphate acyltransferase PlsY
MDYVYAIITAVYRLDIFEHGSKNMGATNVYRVLGKTPFAITLAIDVLKGMMAVIITAKLLGRNPLALFAAGAAALAGHTLSFWVGFKGGKGVASGLGVFMALAPKATLTALLIFMAVLIFTKMVSLGSIIAASSLPFLIHYFTEGGAAYCPYLTAFSAIVAVFVIIKHRANIKRILTGEELTLGQSSSATANAKQDSLTEQNSVTKEAKE